MKNRIIKSKILAAVLLGTVLTTSVLDLGTTKVFAEEAAEETEAVDGAAEGAVEGGEAGLEGEAVDPGLEGAGDPLAQGGGVTPGTILANNGLYIANTFPDSLMPVGFHRQTVAYQGQNIDLAYMDNSDMVVLAYLTDATGAIGDFYLCDTATATMSDYVRLDGGNGRFLIILDPGDNINAPTGFNKTVANINNKNVTAWSLPDGSSSDEKDKKDKKDEDKEASNPLVLKVYAADLGLGIGAGSTDSGAGDAGAVPADGTGLPADGTGLPADGTQAGDGAVVVDNSYTDGTTVDPTVAAAQAAEAAAASVVTDAAGFVKPQPTEYYLIYGIDYNGAQGFFLYDTLGQTYQRYVEIDMGENEETAKYKKSAQIRLFIIAGLILFAVVLIFIIVNMSLGSRRGGSSRRYEGDDDVEEVKRRVKSKERRSVSGGGQNRRYIGEDDYDDDGTLAIWIGGQKISKDYYSISNDHQTLWIYRNLLDQLRSNNSYTLTAQLWRLSPKDGTKETYYPASTSFNILAAGSTSYKSPKTGDNSNVALWAAVAVLSGGAVVALIPKKKKVKIGK